MGKNDTTALIRRPNDTDDDLKDAIDLALLVTDLLHRVNDLEKRLEWLRNADEASRMEDAKILRGIR